MKKKINCEVQGYEDIQFEVGQQWITRGGKVVEITAVYNNSGLTYPVEVGIISYTRNGRERKHREGENDLVELVPGSVAEPAEPAEPAEEPVEYRFEPVDEPVNEPVDEQVTSSLDAWAFEEQDGVEPTEELKEHYGIISVAPVETSVEDKMVDILHQLLAQRDRDLEKISLMFDTFMKLEKMKWQRKSI